MARLRLAWPTDERNGSEDKMAWRFGRNIFLSLLRNGLVQIYFRDMLEYDSQFKGLLELTSNLEAKRK